MKDLVYIIFCIAFSATQIEAAFIPTGFAHSKVLPTLLVSVYVANYGSRSDRCGQNSTDPCLSIQLAIDNYVISIPDKIPDEVQLLTSLIVNETEYINVRLHTIPTSFHSDRKEADNQTCRRYYK